MDQIACEILQGQTTFFVHLFADLWEGPLILKVLTNATVFLNGLNLGLDNLNNCDTA